MIVVGLDVASMLWPLCAGTTIFRSTHTTLLQSMYLSGVEEDSRSHWEAVTDEFKLSHAYRVIAVRLHAAPTFGNYFVGGIYDWNESMTAALTNAAHFGLGAT